MECLNLIIKAFPNKVRFLAFHKSSFVFNVLTFKSKLKCLFLLSSYDKYNPRILTGLFTHCNCNGVVLFFDHFPNHIALVFFTFNFKPEMTPKLLTMLREFSTEIISVQNKLVSSAN